MNLTEKINHLLEQIADGYGSVQRFSTMPIGMEEGGKAFKSSEGVLLASSIPKEFVSNTLTQVYHLLDRSGFVDVNSAQPLGSTLHLSKPELGDLDILIKPSRPFDLTTFKNALFDFFYLEGITVRDLAEKGREYLYDEFSFLFPIFDDNNQQTEKQVQVDLLCAENDEMYNWRYRWYSAPANSAWKGGARNVLLGIIAAKRGFVWAKNGLYQKGSFEQYETSDLVTAIPEEAVKAVFGDTAEISVIESVESMQAALDVYPALTTLKDSILKRFDEVVAQYEADGREMRNMAFKGDPNEARD